MTQWDAHDARTSDMSAKEEATLIRWLAIQRAKTSKKQQRQPAAKQVA